MPKTCKKKNQKKCQNKSILTKYPSHPFPVAPKACSKDEDSIVSSNEGRKVDPLFPVSFSRRCHCLKVKCDIASTRLISKALRESPQPAGVGTPPPQGSRFGSKKKLGNGSNRNSGGVPPPRPPPPLLPRFCPRHTFLSTTRKIHPNVSVVKVPLVHPKKMATAFSKNFWCLARGGGGQGS